MHFEYSAKTRDLMSRLQAFMDEHIYPAEEAVADQIDAGPTRWKPIRRSISSGWARIRCPIAASSSFRDSRRMRGGGMAKRAGMVGRAEGDMGN